MFPAASCLPLTIVLFLNGVDPATSSGFRPDAALVRVTSDDMSNAIWAVDLEQEGAWRALRVLCLDLEKLVML